MRLDVRCSVQRSTLTGASPCAVAAQRRPDKYERRSRSSSMGNEGRAADPGTHTLSPKKFEPEHAILVHFVVIPR